jgi:carbamoyl-phosphate synthase large subunit
MTALRDREPWRVLIFPGATEIALEIRQALAWHKELQLFSAGADVSNHAPFVFAQHCVVPSVENADWLSALQDMTARHRITHIFPAHDDALMALAENAGSLSAKVVTSPLLTCRITRSKSATLAHLRDVVPTPTQFADARDVSAFPVFVKPDIGQGSQRTSTARDRLELDNLLSDDPDRIILEYLPGPEYTVDCFSDRERGLLYAGGRERRRTRSGISMSSVFVDDPRFTDYAGRINARLALHGAWFYQVKSDPSGVLKLMEVAPRIGGTSALSRVRGINLPLLSIYEAERVPLNLQCGVHAVEIDRALVNRYRLHFDYRTIYVDFDDTLVVRGQVNVELVKLLYQAINRAVRLVLITRHAGDLTAALRRYRLEGLFDDVIHLRNGESKADHISERAAIVIDDSFAERLTIHQRTGIPVFDSSMIEVLFDERI